MSRTDVHRPWAVQVADPFNRYRLWRYSEWPATGGMTFLPLYCACGCAMCTERFVRKLQIKQQRVNWRKVRRDLLKTPATDRESMDVAPYLGSSF